MKINSIYIVFALSIALVSCSNNDKAANTTTNADTAILVDDPGNTLNANPVNDTMTTDTVHNN